MDSHDEQYPPQMNEMELRLRCAELERLVAQARANAEFRMRSLVEASPFGAHEYELTDEGRLVFVRANYMADRLLGVDHAQYAGKTIVEAFPPLAQTNIPNEYRRVALHGGIYEGDVVHYTDGMISGVFETSAFQTAPRRVVAFFRDITERKRMENALKESERRYRELVESANSIIMKVDTEGRVTFFNAFAEQFFGFREEEILGRSILGSILPEVETSGRDLGGYLSALLADPAAFASHTTEGLRRNGDRPWIAWTNRPLLDGSSKLLGVLCIGNDITEQKRAEDALARRTKEVNQYFSLTLDLMCIADMDGHLRRINPAWSKTLGWPQEELLSRPFYDFLHPDDVERTRTAIARLATGPQKRDFANRYRCTDGSYRWLDWRSIPDKENQLVYAVARDITERLRAEEELHRLASLVENNNDYIGMADLDGRLVFLNPAGRRLVGLTEDEDVSRFVIEDFIPPESRALFREFILPQVMERGSYTGLHALRHLTQDELIEVDATMFLVRSPQTGEPMNTACAMRDVRERSQMRRTMQALVESTVGSVGREFFSKVIEALRSLIHCDMALLGELTPEGEIRCLSMTLDGVEFPEYRYKVEGTPCHEVLDHGYRCYPRGLRALFPHDGALVATGMESYVGAPVLGEDDKKIGILCGMKRTEIIEFPDASDVMRLLAAKASAEIRRMRAEEEKNRIEEQLRQSQKMESIGRLAGGVAHDFNNLLTTIQGSIELAQMELSPHDPLYETLGLAMKATDSATSLTRQLLAFSRRQVIEPKPLSLNDLLENISRMLKRLIGEDVDLSIVREEGLWTILADPGQVEQVIVNLAVNARDAMPTGGKLTIQTGNTSLEESYCNRHVNAKPGEYVLLAVSDTGCGMSNEVKDHIFEPFFTTKPAGKGTGLGLATIYGIVKQSGGLVDVYSEEQAGSTFKVYFPRACMAPLAPEQVRPERPRVGNETILLVEDEASVRDLAARILGRLGYSVIACANADEALGVVRNHPGEIHLLVSDVVMPGMNGPTLAGELSTLLPGLKVLFTSGYTEDVIIRHGLLTQGIHFLSKPYTARDLSRKVRQLLD